MRNPTPTILSVTLMVGISAACQTPEAGKEKEKITRVCERVTRTGSRIARVECWDEVRLTGTTVINQEYFRQSVTQTPQPNPRPTGAR